MIHIAVNFLYEFSYSNAIKFKEEEKSIITSGSKGPSLVTIMPEEGWSKFWITVDNSKKAMVEEIERSLRSYLERSPDICIMGFVIDIRSQSFRCFDGYPSRRS